MTRSSAARAILLPAIAILCLAGGCRRNPKTAADGPIVLYTSVDEPYARPLVEEFEKSSGLTVTLVTDSEAAKSVGLAEKLRAEKDQPRADVWWSNECFLTIALANEGLLAQYESPAASDIPATYKDPGRRWAGSVLRVRTLVSSKKLPGQHPRGLSDLLDPSHKGRIAIARPTAGTTGGHVAALYTLWGEPKADRFFKALAQNGIHLLGGNSKVAELVATDQLDLGICDNDDAADAQAHIGDLLSALPDQMPDQDGTLAMPCTVAIVEGARHPAAARRLADFLLSARTDAALVTAKFAWCSSRDTRGKGKFMTVNYREVARQMPAAIRRATSLLEGRPLD